MKTIKTILCAIALVIVVIVSVAIVWSIKNAKKTKAAELTTVSSSSPAPNPGFQTLVVKAGEKTILRIPALSAQSVTWDTEEWGVSVIVKYEDGNIRVKVPDGKGGMEWDDHFIYTKGMVLPEFNGGGTGNISFSLPDGNVKEVKIDWRLNP